MATCTACLCSSGLYSHMCNWLIHFLLVATPPRGDDEGDGVCAASEVHGNRGDAEATAAWDTGEPAAHEAHDEDDGNHPDGDHGDGEEEQGEEEEGEEEHDQNLRNGDEDEDEDEDAQDDGAGADGSWGNGWGGHGSGSQRPDDDGPWGWGTQGSGGYGGSSGDQGGTEYGAGGVEWGTGFGDGYGGSGSQGLPTAGNFHHDAMGDKNSNHLNGLISHVKGAVAGAGPPPAGPEGVNRGGMPTASRPNSSSHKAAWADFQRQISNKDKMVVELAGAVRSNKLELFSAFVNSDRDQSC